MRLDQLPRGTPAYVAAVDWSRMSDTEAQRLREFGLCEGASIELTHRGGLFGRGAVAARIGRMTIAMRALHAAAIEVNRGTQLSTDPVGEPALAVAE